jgi:hypothetical protein
VLHSLLASYRSQVSYPGSTLFLAKARPRKWWEAKVKVRAKEFQFSMLLDKGEFYVRAQPSPKAKVQAKEKAKVNTPDLETEPG